MKKYLFILLLPVFLIGFLVYIKKFFLIKNIKDKRVNIQDFLKNKGWVRNNNKSYIGGGGGRGIITVVAATTTTIYTTDLIPTPNPACVCTTGDVCANVCFYDKYASGVTYNSPIKCGLSSSIFSNAPTAVNKNNWCRYYLKTKGDANGDGKVNMMDYFYYVAASFGAKLPPSVNVDLNGDGFISSIDRAILVKTLKP